MSLTDNHLVEERPHLDGVQRVYRVGDFGISAVNGPMLHCGRFAWEFGVVVYGAFGKPDVFTLTYATPLSDDVVVTATQEEADSWLDNALSWIAAATTEDVEKARVEARERKRKHEEFMANFRRECTERGES